MTRSAHMLGNLRGAGPDAVEYSQDGTGFDAQKQLLADIEDAIASPVGIPSSISRYQKTLQYASTPVDFLFEIELYLSPSDMTLHPGNIQGYNN